MTNKGNGILRKGFWFWLVAIPYFFSISFVLNPYMKVQAQYRAIGENPPIGIMLIEYSIVSVFLVSFFLFYKRTKASLIFIQGWLILVTAYWALNAIFASINSGTFGAFFTLLVFGAPNVLSVMYLNSKSFKTSNDTLLENRELRRKMKSMGRLGRPK